MTYDIAIIGAGISGLASACLLSKKGYKVLVLERHQFSGGCASYFNRGPYLFDVGATTLSGMAYNGPLKRLIEDLGLNLKLKPLDPAMQIHLENGLVLSRHKSVESWIEELKKIHPDDMVDDWKVLDQLAARMWSKSELGESFPPQSLAQLKKFLGPTGFKSLGLIPWLFRKMKVSENPVYRKVIDQQLLISTQAKSSEVSIAIGAMGLTYPQDMYYLMGGMRSLVQALEANFKGEIEHNSEVVKIRSRSTGHELHTKSGQVFKSKMVVSAIPIWNLESILEDGELKDHYLKLSNHFTPTWSAVTAYFGFEYEKPISPLYHQVHIAEEWQCHLGESLFFSFSDPDDLTRAPVGEQVVTVSGHWPFKSKWPDRKDPSYKKQKDFLGDLIKRIFIKHFTNGRSVDFKHFCLGTPQTFERFTGRRGGTVGGIPMTVDNCFLSLPKHKTVDSTFFQVGDTTFPGQGIVGVIMGSYALANQIASSKD